MKLVVTENVTINVDGERVLLEEGDVVTLEDKSHLKQLKLAYKEAVAAGDTEKASELATFLDGIGISLD